jgi:integrase/recombinase XerD
VTTPSLGQVIQWERYPRVAHSPRTREWLTFEANLGLASSTIEAYGRALEDYLTFTGRTGIEPDSASRQDIALYVRDLFLRPSPRVADGGQDRSSGLSNATMQQRLTAVRLYYDFLVEEGIRATNPVGRGRYSANRTVTPPGQRGFLPRYRRLPWIPNKDQWWSILRVACGERLRNRLMLAIGYDAALRREELCALETGDVDPSARLIRVRAEVTKNRQERIVPYSVSTSVLFASYLRDRRNLNKSRGPLFLSESPRNQGLPVSIWTWSKVIEGISNRAELPRFTTHTLRHLCLTDLAHAGWDIHEIAKFAGHRSLQTTLLYIHLSGRELSTKLESGMAQIHAWRTKIAAELLG